jgi:hypothetical protein
MAVTSSRGRPPTLSRTQSRSSSVHPTREATEDSHWGAHLPICVTDLAREVNTNVNYWITPPGSWVLERRFA